MIVFGTYTAYREANYMLPYHQGGMNPPFEWTYFLQTMFYTTRDGVIIIALSEVIKQVDKLAKKLGSFGTTQCPPETSQVQVQKTNTAPVESISEPWELTEKDEEKIYDLYAGKAILEITPSPEKGYCKVKVQDYEGPLNTDIKVVSVNDPAAKEVHDPQRVEAILNYGKNEEA
ncbi:hypothetical protein D8M04_12350 [Oceanobacillus piezotolerans]|uniref:Uncharacterized protein n=1 Tax=Oceanobacillus piezotolerans TaxID=2448030 RepID=A0A498D7E6_9BACI|nr:hypothetical protein [Oceanobacillus piezotolerans]RLL43708.1 hypothetical protein D8M04_12350 [Oceanobacillus piezotolerans]